MADPRPLSASEMREARLRALNQTSGTAPNTTTPPVDYSEASVSAEVPVPVLPATEPATTPTSALADGLGEATALSEAELSTIRRLLWEYGAPEDDRRRWHRQGFAFCDGSAGTPTFGLQQGDGGPCGVLAAVQAELLRCLLFGASASHEDGSDSTSSTASAAAAAAPTGQELPSPPESELQVALCEALLTILTRARPSPHSPLVVVTCRGSDGTCCVESVGGGSGGSALPQTPANDFVVQKFSEVGDEARGYLVSVLPRFQGASGVLLFMLSVLLTRGASEVQGDMDDSTQPLIGQFGHCSQELLNLLLSGAATSNVFDGSVPMGDSGLTLRGIPKRSTVGYLTHLEALRYCQVGSYYKTPQDPVWVVGSSSHFTVLFGIDRSPVLETRAEQLLAAASRAFKACDPDENGFIAKDKLSEVLGCLAEPPTATTTTASSSSAASGDSATSSSSEEGSHQPWLPVTIARDATAIDALTAHLETAGAGIILWDDFWRCISRLMSGASLDAVLSTSSSAPAPVAMDSTSSTAPSPNPLLSGSSDPNTAAVPSLDAAVGTPGRTARTESEELADAIAASMGESTPSTPGRTPAPSNRSPAAVAPAADPALAAGGAAGGEDDDLARAIAASLGQDVPTAAQPTPPAATPQPTIMPLEPAAPSTTTGSGGDDFNVAGNEDDDLARAIAASLGNATTDASNDTTNSATSSQPQDASAGGDGCGGGSEGAAGGNSQKQWSTSQTARLAAALGQPPSFPASSSSWSSSSPPQDNNRGERLVLYHFNGLTRLPGRVAKLTRFEVVKRGVEETVGVAVPLGASGGTGTQGGLGSDHAIEDVLRTRWSGARLEWHGQTPPSID